MESEDLRPRWGILLAFLVVLLILASLPFLLARRTPLSPFEVRNFVGKAEVFSPDTNEWLPLRRGEALNPQDKIRTGPHEEIDLQVSELLQLRVKENSELYGRPSSFSRRGPTFRLHLVKGRILGSTQRGFKKARFEISTPVLVAAVRGTEFEVESNPDVPSSQVAVLRGEVEVRSLGSPKPVVVRGLEKTEVKKKEPPLKPVRISREEWDRLKEAYELIEKSVLLEARQMDLSKQSGNLFQHVFDHGTFYTPDFGFAEREFMKEKSGRVYLELKYDVFPAGALVGIYLKTRNLDLSRFKAFSFQVRGDREEGYPAGFRIEFKSGSGIVRAFAPRDFHEEWRTFVFPFKAARSTPISEMTLVFSNDKAGIQKKGVLYFRDFTLQ